MPDTQTDTSNSGFNAFLNQNMAGEDAFIKKYVKPDPVRAEKLTKEADDMQHEAKVHLDEHVKLARVRGCRINRLPPSRN